MTVHVYCHCCGTSIGVRNAFMEKLTSDGAEWRNHPETGRPYALCKDCQRCKRHA